MRTSARKTTVVLLVLVTALALAAWLWLPEGTPDEKWAGVDASVIEKMATESGRVVKPPLIDFSGDLPLFLFALGGGVGGFVAGYCWRRLISEKKASR